MGKGLLIIGIVSLIIGGIGIVKTLGGWPFIWIFIWSFGLKIDTASFIELKKIKK